MAEKSPPVVGKPDERGPHQQQGTRLPYPRPVPLLHCTPVVQRSLGKTSCPNVQLRPPMPSPQTPNQPQSLQFWPSSPASTSHLQHHPLQARQSDEPKSLGVTNAGLDSGNNISRSISDSTLRRAALHLNLNQAVLPSFTSLQQFKVDQNLVIRNDWKHSILCFESRSA